MNMFKKNLKLPKLGMRAIKTFIAVIFTIFLSKLLGFDSPFYATVTVFFCMQGSIIESSEMAKKRGLGTLIGGVFSLVYLMSLPEDLYIIPFGILGIIYMCNLFDKTDIIPTAGVVFLVISFHSNAGKDFNETIYVINRVLETFIGIVVAILINYYIKPPNPFEKLQTLNDELTLCIKKHVSDDGNFIKVKNLEGYRLKLHEFRNIIQFYHKEVNSQRHHIDIKYYMRHLTLFRTAYNHFFILNAMKEGVNEEIRQYHIGNLINVKNELTQRIW